ncbi:MAG: UDP-N-acetylglucosamine 2-epimerase (non-hydrolyzing) [Chthoniobacteraceae bacterium]
MTAPIAVSEDEIRDQPLVRSRVLKLMIVAGARPNFMKIAPIIRAAAAHNETDSDLRFDCCVVHTGQHYDEKMSRIFFRELGIPEPEINLEVGSGSHAAQTATIMARFEPVLLKNRPDWLVVVGDVNSSMACALVAAKLGLKVAHVEAGLRSRDRAMPEEINRLVTDAIADLLLTPSEDADENLRQEGVPDSRIKLVGNVMIDALVANLDQARQSKILERCQVKPKEFAFVTLHRPSNVDDAASLRAIMAELVRLSATLPIIFPIHPRTRARLDEFGIDMTHSPGLQLIEPVGYYDSVCLTESARLLLTDSGGLQEESTWFRTPCLTLRPNTERPVTVTLGSNRLTHPAQLHADLEKVFAEPDRMGQIPPLWDGQTAERILEALVERNDEIAKC